MNEWANYISFKLLQDTISVDPTSRLSLLAKWKHFFQSLKMQHVATVEAQERAIEY